MSFASEVFVYVGRVREFRRDDVFVYTGWIGLMLGLCAATSGFVLFGSGYDVAFPAEAWCVPLGAIVFTLSIAVDTIGHRTIYKSVIARAEGLVHGITIACGIGSVVLLCAAYERPGFWIPAMVLTVFSFVYSLVDEVFHWQRYSSNHADRVEMWSHVGILVGHGTMMLAWWCWYFGGYAGVAETLRYLDGGVS
jgi:hypothetical protein